MAHTIFSSTLFVATLSLASASAGQEYARVERANFISSQQAYVVSDAGWIDKPQIIAVGDVFYQVTRYLATTQAMADADLTFETANGLVVLQKGQILRGHLDDFIDLTSWIETTDKSFVRDGKARSRAAFRDTDGDGTLDTVETLSAFANVFRLPNPVPYHFIVHSAAPDFAVTLSYLGISGSTLRIAYRETSSGMARPAFNEELTFPATIGVASTIQFKGLKLDVLPNADGSLKITVRK